MSPAPSDTNTADIPSAPLPRMQPAHAPNFLPSSSSAFLAGLGLGGLGVAATKAGLGVQRLAAAQLIKRREKKAKAAEERTQTAAVMRAREALSTGPKPQNCRRLVVLGAPRVGKTAILRRFLRDGFNEQYEPTREDFHRKVYSIRGETYQIDILDAAGERDFPAKRRLSILTGARLSFNTLHNYYTTHYTTLIHNTKKYTTLHNSHTHHYTTLIHTTTQLLYTPLDNSHTHH
ncbi:GTP-binding protein Rhes, partial [Tachysurus ichikawai]